MIDILFVTYNSERWLHDCVSSLAQSDYDLKKVGLYFADNCSRDRTVETLREIQKKYEGVFSEIAVRQMENNVGFGGGNNAAARMGHGEFVFCLNTDTTVYPDTLSQIEEEIRKSSEKVGLWELRQLPYEHPKHYDPVTRETSWSSGACFVMRRSLFEKIGGFDEQIFMYGEDVDLSWRVRAEGFICKYIPKAAVNHYSYQSAGEVKPTQYVYSILNNRLLRCKFGDRKQLAWWNLHFMSIMSKRTPIQHGHRLLLKALKNNLPKYRNARRWHAANQEKLEGKTFSFLGWDYECVRDGAFYKSERSDGKKKVSILVRTCGRPDVLRETLISIREQTYPNIEVVIVEDGPDVSRRMIESEFADLDIRYRATGEKKGRCVVGNLAMQMATGDYFNFLDDDDVFYADHVETLMTELERNPEYKIAYAYGFETPIRVLSQSPYRYEVSGYRQTVHFQFNRDELLIHNLFPIQAVMFSRGVYEELGGLNEELDVLEDWNLWVKYSTKHDFLCVEKTTSIYRVPMQRNVSESRQRELDEAYQHVKKIHEGYVFQKLPEHERE